MSRLSPDEIQRRFQLLRLPLQAPSPLCLTALRDLPDGVNHALGRRGATSILCDTDGMAEGLLVDVGTFTCLASRTTPVVSMTETGPSITCLLPFQGMVLLDLEGRSHACRSQEALFYENRSGHQRISFSSGIAFQLQPDRLIRTMNGMNGRDDLALSTDGLFAHLEPKQSRPFRSLFLLVDQLLQDHPIIPRAIGIDEQIYRLVALQQIRQLGLLERIIHPIRGHEPLPSRPVIDRLVDYIAAHSHTALSLTDLEIHSGYSARRLQQLFRQQFDCTPMQYVRRQRLDKALQRLASPEPQDSITSVARLCGYRQVSHFSADFRRQFGCSPSEVLRSARVRRDHVTGGSCDP